MIWSHDRELLDTALAFYRSLAAHVPAGLAWEEIDRTLRGARPAFGFDAARWTRVRAAHLGHQLGLEILAFVPLIGTRAGFYDLRLGDDLSPIIPERLHDPALQEAMKRVLVPPPSTRSDEIVAAMGGVYWDREAPTLPPFLHAGAHFEKGQPLYIIEVMKMFNKVYAPFAGTVVEVVMHDSGVVVRKGQPLFRVEPDEKLEVEDPAARAARIRARTDEYLSSVL
ncbi:MAG: acetyl-CoA carboxylase biotin carboxyl carrier protein subunit [Candidatus Binatia bacterium]